MTTQIIISLAFLLVLGFIALLAFWLRSRAIVNFANEQAIRAIKNWESFKAKAFSKDRLCDIDEHRLREHLSDLESSLCDRTSRPVFRRLVLTLAVHAAWSEAYETYRKQTRQVLEHAMQTATGRRKELLCEVLAKLSVGTFNTVTFIREHRPIWN